MDIPRVVPRKTKDYRVPQSRYPQADRLPSRSILLAPSGSGKTVLLQHLILDQYRDCFARIFVFSPSVDIDDAWLSVKEYVHNRIVAKNDKETYFFDHYDPAALKRILDTQRAVIEYQKNRKETHELLQTLIIVDDFADAPEFSRNSKLLHSLFTRGRHSGLSTIVSTQRFFALHPAIRLNATSLYVFRLRNDKDLQAFLEETSALADKKTLMALYKYATAEPYSFLFAKLTSPRDDMFWLRFERPLSLDNVHEAFVGGSAHAHDEVPHGEV